MKLISEMTTEEFIEYLKINGVTVFVHRLNSEYAIEQLLPKGWVISDYCNTENVFEIEDEADGQRFWLNPFELFHKYLSVDCLIKLFLVKKDGSNWIANGRLLKFDTVIRRKRTYLLAFIEKVEEKDFVPYVPNNSTI